LGNPTSFHLTAGQAHDLKGADALMDYLTQAEAVLADKAYDADERVRKKLLESHCEMVIPSKKNRLNPLEYYRELYKGRHLIENFFAKLKQYRGIATRYDKTAQNFLGAICCEASIIWLN
jgi:transposase